MKRYIRTKDSNLIDLQTVNHSIRHSKIRKINNGDIKVEKQADTIEDLIMVGDLVKASFCEEIYTMGTYECLKDLITELYTKQGNNYILVARKENGEWRVI